MSNRFPIPFSFRIALLALIAIGVSDIPSYAQASLPPEPLTLEKVLELAEARSESIVAATAGVDRARGDQMRARSERFPQLSASASYDRALASEFEGLFDAAGGPPCDPFAANAAAPIEARVTEIERALDCGAVGSSAFGSGGSADDELPFGRKNTWRVNLQLAQNIFAGGRLDAQDAMARAGREIADLTLTSARAQLLFDATEAYYDAALSDRLVTIAEATLTQADATFLQVQAGFNAGAQPEFELLRARVARDNQRPALIRQRANREIALLRLKQLLDVSADHRLELAASLDETTLAPPAVFSARLAAVERPIQAARNEEPVTAPPLPISDRVAVKEIGAQVDLREGALSAARAERLPTVSLNSSYGRVAYPSGFLPTGNFRTNWTVGATVQVPILTGGRVRGDEIVARAELAQSRAQLQETEELAALDTRSAWAELVAARAAWETSTGTIQQASRAYEIADVRYRAGVSTQLELSDARLLLQQSEANRAQAARDLQVARARMALLPELPLATRIPARPQQPQQPFTLPMVPSPQQQPLGGGRLRNAAAQQTLTPTGARP